MENTFVARVRNITNLLFISSILSLIFVSTLPCFAETTEQGIVYYNIETIKNSNKPNIQTLYDTLNLIVICNWILILTSILSYIGLMIVTSNKYLSAAKVIMLLVCMNIIFSALSLVLSWIFIKNTGGIEGARTPFILSGVIVNYQYFQLISSAISLLVSILYLIYVPSFYFKGFRIFKKKKKLEEKHVQEKTKSTENSVYKEKIVVKKSSPKKNAPITEKPFESLGKESYEGYIQEDHADSEQYPAPERRLQTKKEEPIPEVEHIDTKESYERPFKQEIELDIPEQTYPEQKKQPTSPLFEQALSSAIEKRQMGVNKSEEPAKQILPKKKLTIRCPECKNIFTVEKEEGVLETKIECPKCGRKGVIKQ